MYYCGCNKTAFNTAINLARESNVENVTIVFDMCNDDDFVGETLVSISREHIPTIKILNIFGRGENKTILKKEKTTDILFEIKNNDIHFNTHGNIQIRISSLSIVEGGQGIGISGRYGIKFDGKFLDFRIDHCKFKISSIPIEFKNGLSLGVIDHNTINVVKSDDLHPMGSGVQISHDLDENEGDVSWTYPLSLGSVEAIYIEDNTITCSEMNFANAVSGTKGSRVVIRNNVIFNCTIKMRGTCDHRGAFSFEILRNTLQFYDRSEYAIRIESGTGVILNNTLVNVHKVASFSYLRLTSETPCSLGYCIGDVEYDNPNDDEYVLPLVQGLSQCVIQSGVKDKFYVRGNVLQYKYYLLEIFKKNERNIIESQVGANCTDGSLATLFKTMHNFSYELEVNMTANIVRFVDCLDQPGMSLLTYKGSEHIDRVGQNKHFPQDLEPIYIYNNYDDDTIFNEIDVVSNVVKSIVIPDRHYVFKVPEDYEEYYYPHSLIVKLLQDDSNIDGDDNDENDSDENDSDENDSDEFMIYVWIGVGVGCILACLLINIIVVAIIL